MLEFKFFSQLIVKTGVTTKTSDVTHCFFQYKQKLIKKKKKKEGYYFNYILFRELSIAASQKAFMIRFMFIKVRI